MVADAVTRLIIEQAHAQAIAKAIAYLEQEAFYGNKSLIIASFQQGSSREGTNSIPDPLLHTHAIALPMVYEKASGRMESLYPYAKALYRHKMAAGPCTAQSLQHNCNRA